MCSTKISTWKARQNIDDRHYRTNHKCALLNLQDALFRLKTFGENGGWWPHADDVIGTPENIAYAGWYLAAAADAPDQLATVCGLKAKGWQKGDNPWEEHGAKCKGGCDLEKHRSDYVAHQSVLASVNATPSSPRSEAPSEEVREASPLKANEDIEMTPADEAQKVHSDHHSLKEFTTDVFQRPQKQQL